MPEPTIHATGAKPAKAVRLVFLFAGDQVTLVSQQAVDMVLPPSDPVEGTAAQWGFWYELRDAQDRPLYRKVMHHPMREDVEVFSNDPQQPSTARHALANRKGLFVVLVPDSESGRTVTLSSSPPSLALAHQPATVIARVSLNK